MKSKNWVLTQFRDIIAVLAAISRIWLDIRDQIGDIIENELDNTDEKTIEVITGISELLDEILEFIMNINHENKYVNFHN